ncbi:hypothetical protein GCM10010399_14810 [Dactylosporangium fulvum]|uniref:Cupin domain-containing protein n=1 Tax=Dactylosporangium fulvum TaxID=53359 RepID=A0ABY5VTS9_9ACTN|nr:cupin domain-containing protein [Dactylosporangium fulvum]UWP80236.1 cupin domain-containing protein [Dactylosporangium fulvum]
MAKTSLWDDYIERGASEVERVRRATAVIERETCPVELTPLGRVRWYTHPELDGPVSHALYQFELEIPAGSWSGRIAHQGGIVHYVLSGQGYTDLDGRQHAWEATDVIGIPARAAGVTFQHVNTGTTTVRLMVAMVNLDSSLGPFLGAEVRVIEPAPEYAAANAGGAPA